MTKTEVSTEASAVLDFLPARYRQETAHRQSQAWRLAAVAILACGISLAVLILDRSRRTLESQLLQMAPLYAKAQADNTELEQLQQKLVLMDDRAALVTYLSHPWPRTQILAAILSPMPEEISLEQLSIGHSTEQPRRIAGAVNAGGAKAEEEKLEPAQQDLKNLRSEYDWRSTVVQFSGVTDDPAALHAYLSRLGEHPLVAKAELRSLERNRGDKGGSSFRARCLILAGYGQPGGPQPDRQGQDALLSNTVPSLQVP